MGLRHSALSGFGKIGGIRLVERWFGRDSLTVLCYHRVADPAATDFVGFKGTASASPESFARQMRTVATRYNPVSIDEVVGSLNGRPLPERAVLVTFDDGYRDNHDVALPVLSKHSIPAVVFLATDHIGTDEPFWWDRVAWMFETVGSGSADLPVLGPTSWTDPHRITVRWVDSAKRLAESEKTAAVIELSEVLDTPNIGSTFSGMHLDWDMVRAMQARRVSIGAHTCSHPILSRLDPDDARREVMCSVDRVVQETGQVPKGFAYPNGEPEDYPDEVVRAVGETGIALGFTLSPGPARKREYSGDPLRIPRVYVHHTDDLVLFGAKMAGIPRFVR